MLKRFWLDDSGATAIEYTLIAGIMTLLITTAWPLVTGAMTTKMSWIDAHITAGQ